MQKVLVVDDDRDTVLSLTALLRTEAYQALGLHDAGRILAQVRDYRPDVVILDIAMPGKRPVLVALTGEHTGGRDRARSRVSGFDFFLMKPCDPNVLLTLLRWLGIQSPYRSALR